MLPIDPDADPGRRAWLPCPRCAAGANCSDCLSGRNCGSHWQYLLGNQAWLVHLQCPGCGHVWTTDTRWRRGRPSRKAA